MPREEADIDTLATIRGSHYDLVPVDGPRLVFKGQQGEAIGRLGTVEVTVEIADGRPAVVRVGGRAVIVFQFKLTL